MVLLYLKKVKDIAIVGFIVFAMILFGLYYFSQEAVANPSREQPRVQTASATTSVSYMTPGTATTTLSIDSWSTGSSNNFDDLVMFVQFTASSSPHSVLKWRYEYSRDNIDWYSESVTLSDNSTTTPVTRTFHEQQWVFASSTGATATDTRGMQVFKVPVLSRYTRAVFYLEGSPTTNASGAVYAEIVPSKEIQ